MRYILIIIAYFAAASCGDPYTEGKKLYQTHCANCHMDDGQGLEGLIPPLANSDYLQKTNAELACLLINGYKGTMIVNGRIYEGQMPANKGLSGVEIANILNYVGNHWGNQRDFVNSRAVQKAVDSCR